MPDWLLYLSADCFGVTTRNVDGIHSNDLKSRHRISRSLCLPPYAVTEPMRAACSRSPEQETEPFR
jgi:hypothetical protein